MVSGCLLDLDALFGECHDGSFVSGCGVQLLSSTTMEEAGGGGAAPVWQWRGSPDQATGHRS